MDGLCEASLPDRRSDSRSELNINRLNRRVVWVCDNVAVSKKVRDAEARPLGPQLGFQRLLMPQATVRF